MYLNLLIIVTFLLQVAAQTGHQVTVVDLDEKVLEKSQSSINKSLARVAKKKYSDDPKVSKYKIL